jgi:hypothetical protein
MRPQTGLLLEDQEAGPATRCRGGPMCNGDARDFSLECASVTLLFTSRSASFTKRTPTKLEDELLRLSRYVRSSIGNRKYGPES